MSASLLSNHISIGEGSAYKADFVINYNKIAIFLNGQYMKDNQTVMEKPRLNIIRHKGSF